MNLLSRSIDFARRSGFTVMTPAELAAREATKPRDYRGWADLIVFDPKTPAYTTAVRTVPARELSAALAHVRGTLAAAVWLANEQALAAWAWCKTAGQWQVARHAITIAEVCPLAAARAALCVQQARRAYLAAADPRLQRLHSHWARQGRFLYRGLAGPDAWADVRLQLELAGAQWAVVATPDAVAMVGSHPFKAAVHSLGSAGLYQALVCLQRLVAGGRLVTSERWGEAMV